MSDKQSQKSEEDYSEEDQTDSEDERINGYIEAIDLENFGNYLATAKKHRADNEIEESILILRALIEKGAELYNSELNISLADVYFQLGDAWLEKIEKGGEQLLGTEGNINDTSKEDQMAIMSDIMAHIAEGQGDEESEEPEEDANGDHQQSDKEENGTGKADEQPRDENNPNAIAEEQAQDQNEGADEELEDIQVAWENIETARVIISKYLEEQQNLNAEDRKAFLKKLAHCHLRLGNCENRKENFGEALNEYAKCLETLQMTENPHTSRLIAEVCFLMGNTYLYEFEGDALEKALSMYKRAKEILSANIEALKSLEDPESKATVNDLKDICYDLDEKIEELEDEIVTNKENNINKEKLKAIAGNVNDFPKSQFGGEEQVKKLGMFGKKREAPPMDEEKAGVKKVRADDTVEEAPESN